MWPGTTPAAGWPVMNTWWAGQVGRHEFLPRLKRDRYLGTYEIGFCPKAWAQRNFVWVSDPTAEFDKLVMNNALGGNQIAYAWYPMWSRGEDVNDGHQSAGEYLYLGPGTNGAFWNWEGVSPDLSREFGNDSPFPPDGINKWTGVHYNGKVTRESNQVHISTVWSKKRVPLMGESALSPVGGFPWDLAASAAAPHMSRFRARGAYSVYGGKMNYLFTDGSVLTYNYGG
jgi:prepilin-type processing-associated H-X9-DG protein